MTDQPHLDYDDSDDDDDVNLDFVFERNRKYIFGEGLYVHAVPSISFLGDDEFTIPIKLTFYDDTHEKEILLERFCNFYLVMLMVSILTSTLKTGIEGISTSTRKLSLPGDKEHKIRLLEEARKELADVISALRENLADEDEH